MTKYNYFDQNGNYINVENLSLAGIYMRGASRAAIGSATLKIVREYKEAITEPGMSDYHKELAKIHAFDEIVAEVERIDIIKAQTEEDIKGFFEEDHSLGKDDDSNVRGGRG